VPDGLWRGASAELSDHPTAPGRERSEDAGRRPAARPSASPGPRAPEAGRQLSRSRLPLPPVPVASRAPVPAGARTPAAPRTSAAPFRAVPSPEPRADLALDDFPPARMTGGAVAALPRPSRIRQDAESALVSTGPSVPGALRTSGPAPRVPRQTTPAGSPSPAYGDWTKPSRPGDEVLPAGFDAEADDVRRMHPAPGTTAIPERSTSGRRRRSGAPVDDEAPPPVPGPASGPVIGGRAAVRAERQAADMARRKAAKRSGDPGVVLDPEDDAPRKPRRVIKGLLAMTVVALGVLGVYSYVSPETQETAAQTETTDQPDTDAADPTQADVLPALPTTPVDVAPAVTTPVRVPVTVLNATEVTGLAAKVAEAFATGGWETPGVGGYTAGDVAASTVFFTEGDETQRQAAVQLVDAYPQLQGPTPRFFELPADVTAPGLVVVLTGDWQP
jgi:hypothetical protein